MTVRAVPGQFTLVLHSHLPWLANHGRWPVGEEWLYQSWAGSYQPVFEVLRGLADDGYSHCMSLGVTPVLAAQLDDPHCGASMFEWLASWQLRAQEAALARRPHCAALGAREFRAAEHALADFETHWRHGGSAALRSLVDSATIELLGGPLAHSFGPLLDPRLRRFTLTEGLADTALRIGDAPQGIWAPECAYAPGMGEEYAAAGITHFMVDGPALRGETAMGATVSGDVVAFGRDLEISYRVWSPRSGYPGHAAYRDFHTYDHDHGLKPARVTGRGVAGPDKAPYDPDRARSALTNHVEDFVDRVRRRLIEQSARIGRPALVVAAFDTELFGHWWFEGPQWLDAVLRRLPEAGVQVGTLADARAGGFVSGTVDLGPSSWGSGKDWRVWDGPQVADLVAVNSEVVSTALDTVAKRLVHTDGVRDPVSDQIIREALLTVSSDWAFMVSKESAAQYARDRAFTHAHATREICAAADRGRDGQARRLAQGWQRADNLFGALDARRLDPGYTR
ncbi:glycoside hydrolase family 57 protein [Williamsia sp. CHRR-6]|uniref:1,4-alpha-glucan branching protein domain-containing protein n=1 Tax=Williamsia sp. CHRR-6 TaxID=2835871 RepID=UPI001BD9EB23|nr:glycoside hydrolase family 57 protein [Williamsia sp. CHRR-6]MBT0565474.1 glycoside hydrolase family 57 protein [Williamsia sp. CHRR-6]